MAKKHLPEYRGEGCPAFPTTVPTEFGGTELFYGMSLRDVFAAHALQGILSADNGDGAPATMVASWAYTMADAMIAARTEHRKARATDEV